MWDPREAEKRLGVRFKDPALLEKALVHRSYLNENPESNLESNERLEFLGDAVLSLIVASRLYVDFPQKEEGSLTELRASLVQRRTLARAAERLGLGDCLFLGRGEEGAGGRRRPTNLAAALEAMIGAVYLDRGLRQAQSFITRALAEELEIIRSHGVPTDPKSRLQILVQSRKFKLPEYRTLGIEGPDHSRMFTIEVYVNGEVLGRGRGKSKQQAEREAARRALEKLEAAS
jgi:ribonuclease-3